MPEFLRKAIGVTLLFATIGLSTCQSFLEASPPPREGTARDMPASQDRPF